MPFIIYQHDPAHTVGSTDVQGRTIVLRQKYICRVCSREFDDQASLVDHHHIAHPIRHPVLLLHANPVPLQFTLRQRVDAKSVVTRNCTARRISVNGAPLRDVSDGGLANALAGGGERHVRVELINQGAVETYEIRILVPDEEDLDVIDMAFQAQLAYSDVRMNDVRRFSDELPHAASAREYASALADYVIGVLAKDAAGDCTLSFAQFADRYKESLAVLELFDRPLARGVAICLRLNLNDFRGPAAHSLNKDLDQSFAWFRNHATGAPWPDDLRPAPRTGALCPIDEMTERILKYVAEPLPAGDVGALRSRPRVSQADGIKLQLMEADALLSAGRSREAIPVLSQLQHDHVFGHWARQRLEATNV